MIYKWTFEMLDFQHYQNYFLFDNILITFDNNYLIIIIYLIHNLYVKFFCCSLTSFLSILAFYIQITDTDSRIFSIFYEFGCKSTVYYLDTHVRT